MNSDMSAKHEYAEKQAREGSVMRQGSHQRAETGGLISFIICAVIGAAAMNI